MPSSLWTHDFLNEMRSKMDPLADAVVERLFTEGKVDGINRLMRTLVENDDLPASQLPPYVMEYLARTQASVPKLDPEKLRQGQEIFDLFGPEVMMILGFYSLPASYAARKGVQVLYRTGFLQKRPVRRVFETAQMVVDVMTEGGMEPDGRGVRTTQKVRLMHAAIRYMIRHDTRHPWDAQELGQPINQEDMAGTLMTFAYVVLEGMKALRIDLTPEQQEAWLYAWLAVGRILGVDERLMPTNVEEARQLTLLIRQRQVAFSQEGVAMTAALIEGMQALTPDILDGLPASMIHFFLDQDQWQGLNVADMLQVPKPDWTAIIPQAVKYVCEVTDWVGDNTFLAAKLLRFISKDIVEGMLLVERGGQRTPFYIPDHLQDRWRIKPGTRAANSRRRSETEAANLAAAAQLQSAAGQNDSSRKVA
ncbi:oxygenase MpaB family protein [Vitiosangium sp. GDMCC 1.1324]|uniref:oxygenase MpaB family protein n=1 Tax=Vitiosangium sp. (strain GDMCC 1.1324) TaxID=2138576 RepID=UPI00130E1446|nr:oxygenase MpaB family protein [Vitiosangium sp. GDMCC 1.1324]